MTKALSPKQVVRRYLAAMTNGKPGDVSKWAAADIKGIQGGEAAGGHAALEHYAETYRRSVAGWKIEVERMIAEGNWVAAAGRSKGTMNGAAIDIGWQAHYRISRGKVAEVHIIADPGGDEKDAPRRSRFSLNP